MSSFPVLGRGIRSVKRAQHVFNVLMRFGFDQLVQELGLDRLVGRSLRLLGRKVKPHKHEPEEVRVRKAIEALGPTFIKVGQILSTRPDLIPPRWVTELKKLQSDIPPVPWKEVEIRLKQEFPDGLDTLFQSIEHEPIAAASMAQVHRAVLKNGTPIVLKILRPGIRAIIEADMDILSRLADLKDRHFADSAYSASDIVDQFARELERETDLTREGESTDRLRRAFKDNENVCFPGVFWEATTASVLALEEIEGKMLNEIEPGELGSKEVHDLVAHCTDAVFYQCLEMGFFHADPHPGNLFVLPGSRVCFIDCGMTGCLDPTTAEQLADLLYGVMNRNLDHVLRVALSLADGDHALALDRRFRADAWRFVDHFADRPVGELRVGEMLDHFFAMLRRYQLRCPADLVYLIKAIVTIEGVAESLAPDFDIVGHVRPHIESLVKRRFGMDAMRKRLGNSVMGYTQLVEELPGHVRGLFHSLQRKRLSLNLEHKGLNRHTHTMETASLNIAFGLIIASLVIGSAVLILADSMDDSRTWITGFASVGFASAIALGFFRAIANYFRRR